tara:strand:+ start:908 stop:1300 length:393 start_codon:yes stop_codon:yes gene_type:complete
MRNVNMDKKTDIDWDAEIPWDYREPLPAGSYEMTLETIEPKMTMYGLKFLCKGHIEGEDGYTIFVPVPTKFTYRTAVAQMFRANEVPMPEKAMTLREACSLMEGLAVNVAVSYGADGKAFTKRVVDNGSS